jgi:hypothetical protein
VSITKGNENSTKGDEKSIRELEKNEKYCYFIVFGH